MALMSAYGAIWCPYIYFNHTDSKSNLYFIIGEDLLEAKKKSK